MTETPARVLYVDDDEGLRLLVKRTLSRRGYEVVVAAHGDEGLALASRELFDVIALDHYMPGKDGLAVLAELRALPDSPPIVFVTGSDETRVAVAALKAGAADFVVKVVGEEFFDLLDRAFQQAISQVRLLRGKLAAEAAVHASNARLETLLREVNHRVANSLQLVSAFVHMQASALSDPAARAALEDTQRRIEAIGQVHRRLYTSGDVETVDMADYLSALVGELQETWSTPSAPRRLHLSAEPIRLETDRAVSVGVIVNELISNACKYAYGQSGGGGDIRVNFARDGEHAVLTVEDDGCGFSGALAPKGTGLGGKLVKAMAANLRSQVHYDPAHQGVRATLRLEA